MNRQRGFASLKALLAGAAVAGLLALSAGSYQLGRKSMASEVAQKAAAEAGRLAGIAEATRADGQAAETIVHTQYVDRVQKVFIKGDTITKEIPVYVPQESDAACTVPLGFVSVYDRAILDPDDGAQAQATAAGADAGTARTADAVQVPEWIKEPSGVPLTAVLRVNQVNARSYELLQAQYLGLRDWASTQCYAP